MSKSAENIEDISDMEKSTKINQTKEELSPKKKGGKKYKTVIVPSDSKIKNNVHFPSFMGPKKDSLTESPNFLKGQQTEDRNFQGEVEEKVKKKMCVLLFLIFC